MTDRAVGAFLFRMVSLGKHINYHELRDALAEDGCAVCRLASQAVARHLDFLLHESVNDAGVRRDVRRARGFCNRHAWQLRDLQGALGIAIIYRDVVVAVLEDVGEARSPGVRQRAWNRVRSSVSDPTSTPDRAALLAALAPAGPCLACRARETAERMYLRTLVDHAGDPDIVAGFERSGGLCVRHLRGSIEQARNEEAIEQILDMQSKAWEHLRDNLSEFIRKHDYRFRDESLEAEGDSWIRAVAAISGGRGVW